MRIVILEVAFDGKFRERDFVKILDAASKFCAVMKAETKPSRKSMAALEMFMVETLVQILRTHEHLYPRRLAVREEAWEEKLLRVHNFLILPRTSIDPVKYSEAWSEMLDVVESAKELLE